MGMLLVSCGLTLVRGEELRQAMHDFGGISVGMTAAEVRYALGNPAQDPSQGQPKSREWRYSFERHTEVVTFDPAGRVARFSCRADNELLADCPEILGLHIGTSERDLLLRLGAPSKAELVGGEKVLEYPGAGLSFRLRKGGVVEISVAAAGGLRGQATQLAWLMLP